MTELEQKLISALNTFCFQNIWNEPDSEIRANIVPRIIQERSAVGNFSFNGNSFALPNGTEPFYVYVIPANLMYIFSARIVPTRWISTQELCNKYNMLIHTYHLSGKMMQKASVYFLRKDEYVFLAISKTMATKCLKYTEMKDMRFTMYYDSDQVNDIEVHSYIVPPTDSNLLVRREIYETIQNFDFDASHTTIYVDGYEIRYSGMTSIPTNCYVDVINDANAIFTHEIDLTDINNNVAFYSDKDETTKQLIHIPKELNPDNKVLTHNTCTIHVRPKLSDGSVGPGLYLHRCATRSVGQVTHNDISIPLYILDAYRDYLGTQEITLHLSFRQHDKDNVLIRDKNYIDLLYTLDDDTIVDHLLGKVRSDLDFWKASHLEKSVYVEMMFDVPNVLTRETMLHYVSGLGYYHTMALLCKKIVYTDITGWYGGAVRIPKPYLYANNSVFPFVYIDSKKVNSSVVKHVNNTSLNLDIGFEDIYTVPVPSKMTVELFVDGPKSIYKIVPEAGTNTITIPYKDYVILEEFDISEYPAQGLDAIATKSYKEFTNITGNILKTVRTNEVDLLFGPLTYGKTFIIQNRKCVYSFNKDLDADMQNGNPLVLPLHHGVRDEGYEVPIWNTPHVRVYLNGNYLIQGLDFDLWETKDHLDRVAMKYIVLYNLEYLETENNFVEWFSTSSIEENKVSGYVVDDQAAVPDELSLWFEQMTMVHVDGVYEKDVVNLGNILGLPIDGHRQGAPFEACTTVPESISTFLSTYHPNDDIARIQILTDYFYGKQPNLPDILVLPKSHKCFSPYCVRIIRDILNGTLKGISYDPDEDRMRTQFQSYAYIMEKDLIATNKLNLTFVDVFPHYKQIIVPDPSVYRILQGFINLVLPQDNVTSGEVYYDN